jgi:two-component system LytT family response regulator
MIRTVIVDDEPLARRGIRLRLEEEADFDVVGEFASGSAACSGIPRLQPDVVFLDIQMPEIDGFEVLDRLGEDRPAVIFLTAWEHHALRAFSVPALDYLLKPPTEARLANALGRVRAHLEAEREAVIGRRVRDLVQPALAPERSDEADVLHAREHGRILLIRADEVAFMEGAGNYVRLHARGRSFLTRYRLRELEIRLADRFVRIHRRTLVNRRRIAELQPHFNGTWVAVLDDRTVLRIGRAYRGNVVPGC